MALLTLLLAIGIQVLGLHAAPSLPLDQPLLAYLKDRDVWVQPLAGGPARQLTYSGNVSSVAWSTSGMWLAYQERQQLCLVKPDTAQRRVLSTGVTDYAWSPTADRLAYTTPDGTTLVDAGSKQRLELPDIAATTWSPDGQRLAYVSRERLDGTRSRGEPLWAVTLGQVEAATGSMHPVFKAGRPSDYDLLPAGWSAKGDAILAWTDPMFSASVLADGTALWAIPLHDGEPRVLVEKMLIYRDGFDLSPDGTHLVVSEGSDRCTWTNKRITLVTLPNGERTPLTSKQVATVQPSFSPDGTQIAYVSGPALPGLASGGADVLAALSQRHLWVMNRDGSGQRPLTTDPRYRDEQPRWSEDGRQIVFVRLDQQGNASLWRIDAAGGEPQHLITGLTYGADDRSTRLNDRLFGNYGYIAWNSFDVAWPSRRGAVG